MNACSTAGTVALVGCGRLGSAILEGWLKTGAVAAHDLIILTPSEKPAAEAARALGARVNPPLAALSGARTLVLAVKPAKWREALGPLVGALNPEAVIVSVMAYPEEKIMPRILVVDDTDDIREVIAKLLQRKGFDVTTAAGGKQGVVQAASDQPDLILMDLNMPDMDGWQATRTIREEGITTPVIALTAHLMTDEQVRAMDSGFNGYQTKPLELDALLALIEELLSTRKTEP